LVADTTISELYKDCVVSASIHNASIAHGVEPNSPSLYQRILGQVLQPPNIIFIPFYGSKILELIDLELPITKQKNKRRYAVKKIRHRNIIPSNLGIEMSDHSDYEACLYCG
jgi:hypothetical protein